MTVMNDYTHQVLTDDRERELANLAEQNRQVRLALSGRVSWWRRLTVRRGRRIHTAAEHPVRI